MSIRILDRFVEDISTSKAKPESEREQAREPASKQASERASERERERESCLLYTSDAADE